MQERSQRGEQFELGILDCVMPEMSGLELAEHIRNDAKLQDMRLLMLSSLDDGVETEHAERLGLRVLPKPIRQSRLYDAIVSLACKSASATAPVELRSHAADDASKPTHRGDVLIADDNEINRMVAGEIVRSAGFRTTLVANGFEALEAVKKRGYDLVLMDCEMPEMDGFVATSEIRRLEAAGQLGTSTSASPLPIVALTAQAVQGDRQRCLAAGMTEYATKPVDRRKLLETMNACLAARPKSSGALVAPIPSPVAVLACEQTLPADVEHSIVHNDVLDMEQLVQRCMGKADFARRLLNVFSTSADESADQLALCASEKRCEDIARTAHALKGSASNIAAARLSEAAAQLEAAAKRGAADELDDLVTQVLDEVQACRHQIDRVLRTTTETQHSSAGAVSYADFDRR
jgi:Amt family ammonium transporter